MSDIGLVISCIDYRYIDKINQLLNKNYGNYQFDHINLAGGSLSFKKWNQTLIDQIELAIKLHDIKLIIVMDHLDCGAYKLEYLDIVDIVDEIKYHHKNIADIELFIQTKYKDIKFNKYILN